jgi:hypothetical protein
LRHSIIGHGWRRKQAHDAGHDWIKYRRGLCNLCKITLTFLPVFSLPYTLRYVEVVQLDLQREFHRARQNTPSFYSIPQLPLPSSIAPAQLDLSTIQQAIAATRHLLQLLQPQLQAKARRKLHRLAQRLLNIHHELDHLTPK